MGISVPKISIVICCYNQLPYIKYQIQAFKYIYENTFKDFELIISDDGSSDGTGKFISCQKTPFKMKYHWQKDIGFRASLAKNEGIKLAEGEYIMILDGDDFPGQDTFIYYLERIDKVPKWIKHQIGFMGARWRIDKECIEQPYSYDNIHRFIIKSEDWRGKICNIPPAMTNHFSGSNFIVPRGTFQLIGWPIHKGFGFDDWIFSAKFVAQGGKFIAINDAISFHIDHPNNPPDEKANENWIKIKEKINKYNEQFE